LNAENCEERRQKFAGVQVIWHLYKQAMVQANFNASTGLYIASGLLTYGASEGMWIAFPTLMLASCACAPPSHMFLPPWTLNMPDRACLPAEMTRIQTLLDSAQVCSNIYYKEMFLPKEELEGAWLRASVMPYSIGHAEFLMLLCVATLSL
jgi:hypothetical protein